VLATVIWVVCIGAVVIGLLALATTRKTWEDFGKDRLLLDSESAREPSPRSSAAPSERDEEIRQMLEARNARRIRRGEEPVDLEQELRRLTAPAVDPQLREEIRELVRPATTGACGPANRRLTSRRRSNARSIGSGSSRTSGAAGF
jgi:hypothetical protein